MTTTTSPAANGSASPEPKPERLSGMAAIREAEAWRTASLMHSAAFEAEQLANAIYRAVTDAYNPQGISTAAQTATSPEIQARAHETGQCFYAALSHLNDLVADTELPF